MLDELVEPAEMATATGLLSGYRAALARLVEAVGVERASRESGVDAARLAALGSAEPPDLPLGDVAAVLALSERWPDRETVERELRDDLLVGMSNAVLDAAAVARAVGPAPDLDADAIRAVVEGDREISLAAYARLRHHLASEVPD